MNGMASNTPMRSLRALALRPQQYCSCSKATAPRTNFRNIQPFSTSTSRFDQVEGLQPNEVSEAPRWSYTPEKMKAPFPSRVRDPRKAWEANSDPARVDAMYRKFLGLSGDKILTEEVKWLAITHKSFDQGRRGFNDRLAFFGKRILLLQSTLSQLHSPLSTSTQSKSDDPYNREPFQHPALSGLENLDDVNISDVLTKQRISQLAISYDIGEVTRWKPRNPANMEGSGCEIVYAISLYGIIGALALQKGAYVANQIARERVLKPLGIS